MLPESLGLFYAAFVRLVNLLALALSSPVAGELHRTWFLKVICPRNAPPSFDPFYPVLSTNKGDVAALYSALKDSADYADLNNITAIVFNNSGSVFILAAEPRRDVYDNNKNSNKNSICTNCGGMCPRLGARPPR
jgi:hypothetical protein